MRASAEHAEGGSVDEAAPTSARRCRARRPGDLSPDEAAALSRAWRHGGDRAARDRLVAAFVPLADGLAVRRSRGRDRDRDDLRSEARETLVRAADHWDPERPGAAGFVCFATVAIRRALRVDAIRWRSVLGSTRSRIERALAPGADRPTWFAGDLSLDAPIGDDSPDTWIDRLASDATPPDVVAATQADLGRLRLALEQLKPRERLVLVRRAEGASLKAVGAELGGLTRERARQIEARAIESVRRDVGERGRDDGA